MPSDLIPFKCDDCGKISKFGSMTIEACEEYCRHCKSTNMTLYLGEDDGD